MVVGNMTIRIAKRTTPNYPAHASGEFGVTRRGATDKKDHPLSMRLPDADIAIIDRAASLQGRSRTDFVRGAAVQAAEEVLMERGLIRMSTAGFSAFMKTLTAPARPVPEMVEVLKRPAPWEAKGSRK
jgi:uncharacterized protein (DUF1778 family)